MIDNHHNIHLPSSFVEAIKQVQSAGKADFKMTNGDVAKLTRTKLLQNYEAILRMAGIEQILGESIRRDIGFPSLSIPEPFVRGHENEGKEQEENSGSPEKYFIAYHFFYYYYNRW